MTAIQFCEAYVGMLNDLEDMLLPKYKDAFQKLYKTDPQDLVRPGDWFPNEDAANGYLLRLIQGKHKPGTRRDWNRQ